MIYAENFICHVLVLVFSLRPTYVYKLVNMLVLPVGPAKYIMQLL